MNRQDVTRAMIELAVDRGIRDMKSDSHRTLRRMADLGRQFARGRFQDHIFDIFQRLLSRDDSPYYDMIDQLLTNTSPAGVKRFGMNVGYNGWTYGAAELRKKRAETGLKYPWLLPLLWNPSSSSGLTMDELYSLVTENRKNGTYCYRIRIQQSLAGDLEIFKLFSGFLDCAFLLDLSHSDCILTPGQLLQAASCPNLMIILPHAKPDSRKTAQALLAQRSLFAVSALYRDEDADAVLDASLIRDMLSYGSVILALEPDDGCSPAAQQTVSDFILGARMEQKYPAILLEWNADLERVNQIIYTD